MKVISILKDEKRQYSVNRKAATISALPPGKMLQVKMYFLLISRMIKEATFTYSLLGKTFLKQRKTILDQEWKQAESLKYVKPGEQQLTIKDAISEGHLNAEVQNEIERVQEIEKW